MKDRTKKPPKRSNKRKPNPLRTDPTKMATMRRELLASIARQFRFLKERVKNLIIKENVFGMPMVVNTRWVAKTDPEKVKQFKLWLADTMGETLTSEGQQAAMRKYIEQGYRKGAGRSFDDVRRGSPRVIPTAVSKSGNQPTSIQEDIRGSKQGFSDSPNSQPDDQFYNGTKEEFLRSSFAQPVAQEKVELLASRCYDDMEGMTNDMATRMSRTLTDGLVEGKSPYDVADDLVKDIDISQSRANTIARTELVRAHAEGQLLALEGLGVEELGVDVEWSTAGDDKVCPLCSVREGKVIKIKDAKNLIPFHPNCVVGETKVSADDILSVMKTNYTGEVIEFITTEGRSFTVTPNHILLTEVGFLKAQSITEGVNIVNASNFRSSRTPYDDRDISSIADIFAALLKDPLMLSKSMPHSPEYLHGDGSSCNSEINIVWPDRELWNKIQAETSSQLPENLFITTERFNGLRFHTTISPTAKLLHSVAFAFDGTMGIGRDYLALLNASLLHAREHSLTPVAGSDTGLFESPSYSVPITIKKLRQSENTFTIQKQLDNLLSGQFSHNIFTTVVTVTRRHVENLRVYDLQTRSTLYQLEGVISSNCRCAWIPANVGEDDKDNKDDDTKELSKIAA